MKKWLSLLCLSCLLFSAKSQTAEDSVKATVERFFEAMKNSDSSAIRSCFTPGAIVQTIMEKPGRSAEIRTETVSGIASAIGNLPKLAADERIRFEIIRVDAALASVWTPYSFYYQGVFSHCGVNSFQLVRTSSGWSIQYIIDTRRKAPCVNAP